MITITLNKIRARSPCESGWKKLLIGHFCAAVRDHVHGCTDDGRQRLLDYYNYVIKQYPGG